MTFDPTATDPGSAEGRQQGCICDPQEAKVVGWFCQRCQQARSRNNRPCPHCGASVIFRAERRRFDVEPYCPVHGLGAMRAYLNGD